MRASLLGLAYYEFWTGLFWFYTALINNPRTLNFLHTDWTWTKATENNKVSQTNCLIISVIEVYFGRAVILEDAYLVELLWHCQILQTQTAANLHELSFALRQRTNKLQTAKFGERIPSRPQ